MSDPIAYFVTCHTYGTWLPGHARGSVDERHSAHGTPFVPADAGRVARSAAKLVHEPVTLDGPRPQAVQDAIVEVCRYRQWRLHALHVRTTHFHVVASAPASPEKVMNDFKAYATRRLRREGLAAADARVWSTHGSTIYLWTEERVAAAIVYVVERQGAPLRPAPFDVRNLSKPSEPGA